MTHLGELSLLSVVKVLRNKEQKNLQFPNNLILIKVKSNLRKRAVWHLITVPTKCKH